MAPTPTDADPRGLCTACNYSLRGLSEHRCPECGHAFDPADPWTMNMGRPLSPASRWLLTPTGWPLLIAALSSLALLLYLTDPRSLTLRPSALELRTFLRPPLALWKAFASWPTAQKLFAAAAALCAATCLVHLTRSMLRWLIAIARRQWRFRPPDRGRKSLLTLAALAACLILIFHGYPLRTARLWVRLQLAAPAGRWGVVAVPMPASHEQSLLALERGVLYLETPRLRTGALDMLLRYQPYAAPAVLEKALAKERDPALLARQVLTLSIYRRMAHAPLLEPLLDHDDPQVRAAATDALGFLHMPAFAIPAWGSGLGRPGAWIDADPPIEITPLLGGPQTQLYSAPNPAFAVPVPPHRWQRLRRMMLEAPTQPEREAAARALLRWPPKNYRLRVAEWAVWRAGVPHTFELTESPARPAPPFVHGNDRRLIFRPVLPGPLPHHPCKAAVFFETDHPLALDVMIEMQYGRPRLAYPRPDHVVLGDIPAVLTPPPLPGDLALLPRQYRDFPWVVRAQSADGLPRVRWQSLVLSPGPPPPGAAPTVSAQHQWYERLRAASSSSLSTRGETERFLFYDGPTFAAPPVEAKASPRGVELRQHPLPLVQLQWSQADAPDAKLLPQPSAPRHGLLITVRRSGVEARSFPIPMSDGPIATDRAKVHTGEHVAQLFQQLLTGRGLSPAEARSLLDTWSDDLFRRDGRRFVLLLSADDYNTLCPMRITPAPTALHRVAVIITELSPS